MSGKVCIIVLNYKNWRDTLECMESVLRSNYLDYRLVVIDNASPNESWERLDAWRLGKLEAVPANLGMRSYSEPHIAKPIDAMMLTESDAETYCGDCRIVIVKANKNGGFAAGNNIGIRMALRDPDATHIWLLNNDVVVQQDALTALMTAGCQQNSKNGIIGAKMRYYYRQSILQGVCGRYCPWTGISGHLGDGMTDDGDLDNHVMTSLNYPIGASMFVSLDFIRDVGMLREDYFLYFEELDWCLRGWRSGWRMAFCPEAVVFHKEGGSIGSSSLAVRSELADYFNIANRLKITRRYFRPYLPVVLAGLIMTWLRRMLCGRFRLALYVLPRAVWEGLFK